MQWMYDKKSEHKNIALHDEKVYTILISVIIKSLLLYYVKIDIPRSCDAFYQSLKYKQKLSF